MRALLVGFALLGMLMSACQTQGPGERFNRQMREQQCAGYTPDQPPYEEWGCDEL